MRIDLPFDAAIQKALETKPVTNEDAAKEARQKRRVTVKRRKAS